ncbi:MAG: transglutaminase domain-containing protein [Cyanobacteria bacterium P01_F01_bin.150]
MNLKKLNFRFLAKAGKRRHKQRNAMLVDAGSALLLVGVGLILSYWCQYYGWTSIRSLTIMGSLGAIATVIIWCHINQRPIPFSPQLWRLTQGRPRHLIGLALGVLIVIYQANPNIVNVPVGEVFTRLTYAPSPHSDSQWPWNNNTRLHPVIASLPVEAETSIESVARYIAWKEPNPTLQVKAIHDYVVQRLTYDRAVLETGQRPPQDARSVFVARTAVCEGYARLFQALGRAAGLDVVYLTGKVRRDLAPVDVIPKLLRVSHPRYDWTLHAWNAVKVDEHWYLVDTTWDDGSTYDASYLMLPPDAMIASHLPTLPSWQLRERSITRQQFEQFPILTPQFFASQLTLLSPATYQTHVDDQTATIDLKTPSNYTDEVMAYGMPQQKDNPFSVWDYWEQEKSVGKEPIAQQLCQTQRDENRIHISCPLAKAEEHQVFLLAWNGKALKPLGQLNFRIS